MEQRVRDGYDTFERNYVVPIYQIGRRALHVRICEIRLTSQHSRAYTV